MNRSFIFIIFFCLVLSQLWSVPANPDMIHFTQSDGSELDMYQKGDEFVHWSETVDGYTILNDGNNIFFYAILDKRGDLGRSGIQAHNINQRSAEEISFLSTIQKHNTFSKSQIDLLKDTVLKYASRNSRAFPTTGTNNLLMILANFNDTSTTYTQSNFNNYMNQVNYNGTGSFKDYYLECSYGQLTLNTTVTNWVTLPNSHDYYGPDTRWGEFAYKSVQAADPYVNYSQYDNDNDGTVDGIAIIHQGPGQEATSNTNDIWSHSWDLASAGYSAAARTFDGVLVSSYTTQPETSSAGTMATIGVMCHEFGHNLGAPDFYDTNYSTGGQYDGTGYWDVMASGSYNGSNGTQPAHHNTLTKWYYYGWCTPTLLSTSTGVSMSNSVNNSTYFYYYTTTTSNEYFLLENRQQTGFDIGLPGHGLIILHVDQDYIDAHDSSNDINAYSQQGLYPKAANGTINAASCPFPGTSSNTSFTDTTTPNSQSWASANTNKPITNIQENGGLISFDFMGGNSAIPDITVNPTSYSETLGLSQSVQRALTIANDGESGSVLNYIINNIGESSRNISGSTFTSTETDYNPNTTFDLNLTINNASTDDEWLDEATLDFPTGVTVNSSTNFVGGSDGDLVSDNSTGDGVIITWSDTNGSYGNIHGGENATATVNITVDSGFSGNMDNNWTLSGDIYGSTPHDISGILTLLPAWLEIDQTSGSVNDGSSDNLTLTFNSTNLSAGTYNANIDISSNDPDEAVVTIPVTLIVNDNISSGSGNNGGGSGPAVVDMPLTNIDGISVDPNVSIDPAVSVPISVDITVTDEVQGSTPVQNPDNVIISYDVNITGTVTGTNLVFDLEFTGLSAIDQVYWLNGSNWEVPNGVSWATQNHVTFNLTLDDRNASTEIILSRDDPLPVNLSSFSATYINNLPRINWSTQAETDNIGWYIHCSNLNNYEESLILNTSLIPGNGTTSQPSFYSYTDEHEIYEGFTYWYWLESVSGSGETETFGPVSLTIPTEENNIPAIPLATELYHNFPNPFNPSTLISFDIKEDENGRLSIYNVKGQLILTDKFESGRHQYTWDASDEASGIYLYKLKTNSYIKIMKMILVK